MLWLLTTCVKAASLYQVNFGLVTVVLLAVSVTLEPEQTVVSFAMISAAVAGVVVVTVTALAALTGLAHLLSPLTVT